MISFKLTGKDLTMNFKSFIENFFSDSLIISGKTGLREDSISIFEGYEFNHVQLQCEYTKTRADKFHFDFLSVGNRNENCFEEKVYSNPEFGDILITELMIDPTPIRLLPEQEYIELYNNSRDTFLLKNILLEVGSSTYPLPNSLFLPDDYIVLTKDLVNERYQNYDLPTLSNEAFEVSIKTLEGKLIHELNFNSNNYHSIEGGVSLELQNYKHHCFASSFNYSHDFSGGTPGKVSSSFEEDKNFRLLYQTNEYSYWNGSFLIKNSLTNKLYSDTVKAFCDGELLDTIYQISNEPLEIGGGIEITEVLTNPYENCSEFIELFNPSDTSYFMNLILEIGGQLYKLPEGLYFLAKGYMVLTNDQRQFFECYDLPLNASILEVPFLNLNSESELITVYSFEGSVIDEIEIQEEMHYEYKDLSKGVSLEKYNGEWTSCISSKGVSPGKRDVKEFRNTDDDIIKNKEFVYSLTEQNLIIDFDLKEYETSITISLIDKS